MHFAVVASEQRLQYLSFVHDSHCLPIWERIFAVRHVNVLVLCTRYFERGGLRV